MLLHAVTYTERERESYIALVDLYAKRNFPLSMARAAAQPRRCSIKRITFGFVRTRRIKDDVQWAITNQPKTHIHCIHRLETRTPLPPSLLSPSPRRVIWRVKNNGPLLSERSYLLSPSFIVQLSVPKNKREIYSRFEVKTFQQATQEGRVYTLWKLKIRIISNHF